jgi:arginine deiminase
MIGKIRAEWDPLKKVVVHKPGVEMFLGLLEPYASLYERAFSRDGARREHDNLVNVLRTYFGVEVFHLKETILNAADKSPRIKEKLMEMAAESRIYGGDENEIKRAKLDFERNSKYIDTQNFFYTAMINPEIHMRKDPGARNVELNIIARQPITNLYFMRDQQFVTDKGIVMSRMAKPSRRKEPKITKFLWEEVFGLPIVHEIEAPGTIEGGEFIPMGEFAMVGIGDRTNRDAIDQLLKIDFEFQELAVVHQPGHPLVDINTPDPMIDMHLDTYFNVASSKVVVGCELLIRNARVEIYHNEGNGKWVKDNKETNLYEYITGKGFHVINITSLEQLCYASNFLCIHDGKILAIESERNVKNVLANLKAVSHEDPKRYSRLYAQAKKDYEYLISEGDFFPHKKEVYRAGIDAYPIILTNLTGGYGGAHCMTCALERGV